MHKIEIFVLAQIFISIYKYLFIECHIDSISLNVRFLSQVHHIHI
jgi:hypothetical protein